MCLVIRLNFHGTKFFKKKEGDKTKCHCVSAEGKIKGCLIAFSPSKFCSYFFYRPTLTTNFRTASCSVKNSALSVLGTCLLIKRLGYCSVSAQETRRSGNTVFYHSVDVSDKKLLSLSWVYQYWDEIMIDKEGGKTMSIRVFIFCFSRCKTHFWHVYWGEVPDHV